MRWCVVLVAVLAGVTPAAAQSTYIGASLVGDIARFDRVDFDGDVPRIAAREASGDAEALGFNLKIGRAISRRWGVEFEFARSGEMEHRSTEVLPLRILPAIYPPPDFSFDLEIEQRFTTYGALAWVRQDLGRRADITFLGGVAFTRADVEQDVRVTDERLAMWLSVIPDMTLIDHSIAPVVGAEAAVRLSDAAALTGGVRVQGVSVGGRAGWLLRPNAGLRWTF